MTWGAWSIGWMWTAGIVIGFEFDAAFGGRWLYLHFELGCGCLTIAYEPDDGSGRTTFGYGGTD